mgnify:CR=1 FL=1
MNNLLHKKNEFRKKQYKLRKNLYQNIVNIFNETLFEELFNKINFDNINIVSSFVSINTEINTTQLNNYILNKKKILCLPVVLKKNTHLVFRKYTNENQMINGFMNIKEPARTNEVFIPELLFVPCLAYDNFGFRLGYGGGYYDRTFNHLKKNNIKFVSVGYAFEDQKVLEVPKDNFDIKLDYVITEKNIYSFL